MFPHNLCNFWIFSSSTASDVISESCITTLVTIEICSFTVWLKGDKEKRAPLIRSRFMLVGSVFEVILNFEVIFILEVALIFQSEQFLKLFKSWFTYFISRLATRLISLIEEKWSLKLQPSLRGRTTLLTLRQV